MRRGVGNAPALGALGDDDIGLRVLAAQGSITMAGQAAVHGVQLFCERGNGREPRRVLIDQGPASTKAVFGLWVCKQRLSGEIPAFARDLLARN